MKPDLQALSVYVDDNFVNCQEAGKHKTSTKIYIPSKSTSKKYVVQKDSNNKKYVMVNGRKVLLQSLRGKYRYTH